MTVRRIFKSKLPDGVEAHLYSKEVGDLEIHIDGAWGLTFTRGTCKINLYTIVPTEEEGVERREVAARITMLLPTLFAMRKFFNELCDSLDKMGVVTTVEQQTGKTVEKTSKSKKAEK